MPEFGFDLEEVASLIRLVEERGLAELSVEEDGRRIAIKGVVPCDPPAAVPAASQPRRVRPRRPARQGAPPLAADNRVAVTAPMVGVYYRSPSPDAAPFVDVGDRVEAGQVIGIIEAMKVFSEVPSEHSGTVVEVAVENGTLVRQGQPLLYLRPD